MEKEYFISLYLDTRRALKSGFYPVRLRVFTSVPRIQKFYPTVYEFKSEAEFTDALKTKPPKKIEDLAEEMKEFLSKARRVAKTVRPFSFERFERKYLTHSGDGTNVFDHYDNAIAAFIEDGRIGYASSFELSVKSFKKFIQHRTGKEAKRLLFAEITVDWLNKYERYMIDKMERSRTTVAIYLRTLRAVFNTALREEDIKADLYPFGENKYQMPSVEAVKKAFNLDTLHILHRAEPLTVEQEKAKAFWFFSFYCSGINIKDIALMKWKNIQDRELTFVRAKTANTKKRQKEIRVHLTDYALNVIEKYGNKDRSPNNYVFDIVSDRITAVQKHAKIKNFTRFINQNIKRLAANNGVTVDISVYWARHSFSTQALRNGVTMEMVSEALGHSDLKVTQGYFAGFTSDTTKDIAEKMESIMNLN